MMVSLGSKSWNELRELALPFAFVARISSEAGVLGVQAIKSPRATVVRWAARCMETLFKATE